LKIEDSFVVAAPIEHIWSLITDPEVVGPCVPGCEGIEVMEPGSYRTSIRVALGPIKTTFNLIVTVTEEQPPRLAASTTRGEEGTRASTLTAHNVLCLEALDKAQTEVRYSSEVSLVGRLGTFGLGVMKKKAKALGEAFAEAFRERAEARETA
jgi:carbon monoxide dehydrogenase subunit G